MSQPSSIYRRLTCLPAGPVCAVISVWPSISLAYAATSSTDLASRTPPFASLGNSLNLPLPRPPAWIWDFTTYTGPGRVFAADTASLTVSAGCPSETGAPKLFRMALLWYSWIFMSSSTVVFCMPELRRQKRKADRSHLFVFLNSRALIMRTDPAFASTGAVSLPRMKARRIGLMTNNASSAAVAFRPTATTKTACQPDLGATMLASGTNNEAVPFAVYNIPLLVVANFAPKVSPLVAGNRLYISPNTPKYAAVARTKTTGMWP